MRRYYVCHVRLEPGVGTCRRRVLGWYEVDARSANSALQKVREHACPLPDWEYLSAARVSPGAGIALTEVSP